MKRSGSINLMFLPIVFLFGITFAVLVSGASSISYADDHKLSESANPTQDLKLEIAIPNTEQKMARSGCCSWHGGVCDCIGGRVVCCDGTFSPTCTCHHDSNRDVLSSKE
jgi:hypothetical protein